MGKKAAFTLRRFLAFCLLLVGTLILVSLPAGAGEKNAPEGEPAIKAGPGSLLPTARNLSDVRAMIRPQKALYNHKYHALSRCGMLGAKIELKDKYPQDPNNSAYFLKGIVILKVKVDKKHAGFGLKNGHGVKLYVDHKLLNQNDFLIVSDPKIKDEKAKKEWADIWEWKLDTTRFPDGFHTVAVNVCDHFDHYGVDSFNCYIGNKEGKIQKPESRK
ncbi:MAG: hypothetical protein V2A78_13125 [bacterium]